MEQTPSRTETSKQTATQKREWATPRLRAEGNVANVTLAPISGSD